MNQFLLTFKDKKIEDSYQQTNQQQKRMVTFVALSFGFIIAFLVKVIQSVSEKNMYAFFLNLFMLLYLSISLFIVWKTNKYLRFAIVLLNHIVTIFFIAFEDRKNVDNQMAMLQGVNQMAATYLLVLTGEYLDGMITIFSLQIFRIFWGALLSHTIQFSALITSTLLIFYINYFNYQYNKAKRSQYLLTLVESRWEEILNNLNLGQSFLILQFDEQKLKYQVREQKHCEKIFNHEKGVDHFLKHASLQTFPLENFLFQEIRKFQKLNLPNYNNNVLINYEKRTIRAEISIYQGNAPTILLIFRQFFYEKRINLQLIYKQYDLLVKVLVKVLNRVAQYPQCQSRYQPMQRKIILSYLVFNAKKEIRIGQISLNRMIKHVAQLYGNLSIKFHFECDPKIQTSINILQILLIQIFENTLSTKLTVTTSMNSDKLVECIFEGIFDGRTIDSINKYHDLSCQLLFQSFFFSINCKYLNYLKNLNLLFKKAYTCPSTNENTDCQYLLQNICMNLFLILYLNLIVTYKNRIK